MISSGIWTRPTRTESRHSTTAARGYWFVWDGLNFLCPMDRNIKMRSLKKDETSFSPAEANPPNDENGFAMLTVKDRTLDWRQNFVANDIVAEAPNNLIRCLFL